MISTNGIISRSVLAGIVIGIGGFVYLSSSIPIIGSILFSVGLISVVLFKLKLFTGTSGFLSEFSDFKRLNLVLLLNLLGAFTFGLIVKLFDSNLINSADLILQSRLDSSILSYIIRSVITGFLMTLAIKSEKVEKSNHIVLILCVFTFIYSGCYHCIADTFYYGVSSILYECPSSLILRLLIVIIGNFLGCNLYNIFVNQSFMSKEVSNNS